jgi:hypothetical protein
LTEMMSIIAVFLAVSGDQLLVKLVSRASTPAN